MGWSIGYDFNWDRDTGYGVPAICDHPGCSAEIDRGLSYVCGGEPYGGNVGCGLFFCGKHRHYARGASVCPRCAAYKAPYKHPKPDTAEWMRHKLRDTSWMEWRKENPTEVEAIRTALRKAALVKAA